MLNLETYLLHKFRQLTKRSKVEKGYRLATSFLLLILLLRYSNELIFTSKNNDY